MTAPRVAYPPPPADRPERERVRVELDGHDVTLPRDYLMTRRRALIQELNALNESLGIRRAPRDTARTPDEGG